MFIHYSPIKPDLMDWSSLYPQYFFFDNEKVQKTGKCVEFADIGCGYGGLLGNLYVSISCSFIVIQEQSN